MNLVLFGWYFNRRKGILIEKNDEGEWDVDSINAWDDASEAERRNER
jgi:hypothetical protein